MTSCCQAPRAGESVSVDYQSKRSIRPTASETDFVEVMVAVVRTMRADRKGITQRLHRVGLAARLPQGPLEELRIVASLAYGSADSATFLELLRAGGINQGVCDRFDELCGAICVALTRLGERTPDEAALQDLGWQVAAALEVWIADVESGGRDAIHAVNRLGDLVGGDRAHQLYATLLELAEDCDASRCGRQVDAACRARPARSRPRCRPSWTRRLRRPEGRNDADLASVTTSIAGSLRLPRTDLLTTIATSARERACTLVTGKAGAGKSVPAFGHRNQQRRWLCYSRL